ncbi:type VI secretion system-associated protein TagF [Aliirhizobium terrae]|uniref:type VI secretion system-associated protein TagF n=1 Tax=Terrirhizobium terrae TaxID=2926709 RepID=UPI00257847DE|nr:type VI secretion system-associated protein TagF [Rhizobium sp. CC-CFT758]WJH41160.1 type VI secretion system-associated protein TagF [Rhizobium sp. CC-CFT758]
MNQRQALDQATLEADRIGFFGKLPTHGDFVSTGFSRSVQDALDAWLQTGLAKAQHHFGERWEKDFRAMPAWRFIVERGLWGPMTMAGVIVPSRDRVGRSFPLVVATQLHDFAGDSRKLCLDDTWFIALEGIAETSAQRDFELDAFTANLKRLRSLRPGDFDFDDERGRGKPKAAAFWWRFDPDDRQTKGFRSNGVPQPVDFLELVMAGAAPAVPEAAAPQPIQPARIPSQSIEIETVEEPDIPIDFDLEEMMAAAHADLALLLNPQQEPASTPTIPISPTASFRLSDSHATHPGTRLSINADAVLVRAEPAIFAVADGLGDGSDAVEASRATIALLSDTAPQDSIETLVQDIKGKLGRAHGLLQSTAASKGITPPCASIVALAAVEDRFALVWAGDTRGYLVRDGMMRCITRDHVSIGLRRSLSRAIGLQGQLSPEVLIDTLQDGDRFLLCSNPLARTISERIIAELLLSLDVEEAAERLVQEALIANCRDNVSAVVIDIKTDHGG